MASSDARFWNSTFAWNWNRDWNLTFKELLGLESELEILILESALEIFLTRVPVHLLPVDTHLLDGESF